MNSPAKSAPPTQLPSQLPAQLPLPLALPKTSRFENFVYGQNEAVVAAMQDIAQNEPRCNNNDRPFEPLTLLTGSYGKTHLLQAACHAAKSSFYLPLKMRELVPEMLHGIEQYALVALDDVDCRADDQGWETALYDSLNRCRANHTQVVVSMQQKPADIAFTLPDLQSRLQWGPAYQLQHLSETDMVQALQLHANMRAITLPAEVAEYLLKRHTRDLRSLLETLQKLDQAQLAEKRQLTIPFVKATLDIA